MQITVCKFERKSESLHKKDRLHLCTNDTVYIERRKHFNTKKLYRQIQLRFFSKNLDLAETMLSTPKLISIQNLGIVKLRALVIFKLLNLMVGLNGSIDRLKASVEHILAEKGEIISCPHRLENNQTALSKTLITI